MDHETYRKLRLQQSFRNRQPFVFWACILMLKLVAAVSIIVLVMSSTRDTARPPYPPVPPECAVRSCFENWKGETRGMYLMTEPEYDRNA